mmetsp:Transcript_32005/g.46642  ORF Transcript_32005/g.46642 Transcript_32005/m.46642 type:complete len:117 (+) Transcript_32005:1337-1687(+)
MWRELPRNSIFGFSWVTLVGSKVTCGSIEKWKTPSKERCLELYIKRDLSHHTDTFTSPIKICGWLESNYPEPEIYTHLLVVPIFSINACGHTHFLEKHSKIIIGVIKRNAQNILSF